MWQIEVNASSLVMFNYEKDELSTLVKTFRPIILKEKNFYWCLLGPNTDEGIIGYGKSLEAAIADWELSCRTRMIIHGKEDKVANFARHQLMRLSKKNFS